MEKSSNVNGLYVHNFPGTEDGVLVFPGLGVSAEHTFYQNLGELENSVHIVELRGHGKSQGHWTLEDHRRDIAQLLQEYKKQHRSLFTIASGLSASLLLEHEKNAHEVGDRAVPDGMVLLSPTLQGALLLPKDTLVTDIIRAIPFFNRKLMRNMLAWMNTQRGHVDMPKNWVKAHYGQCRVPEESIKLFWDQLCSYAMPSIRVQTPTTVFLPQESAGHLDHILGNVHMKKVSWITHGMTRADNAQALQHMQNALTELMQQEAPIRFRQ